MPGKVGQNSPAAPFNPTFAAAKMLYIHPDECIDCGACVPACPVEAIFALEETPDRWTSYIDVNREYYAETAR